MPLHLSGVEHAVATAPVRPVEYDSPTADFADVSTASLRRAL
ncbi:hypothetical protein G155_00129 [Mycobacterium sp. VKM Ac-1817D]|nr:hypothetical protein G155_00129 [Mycobacterium sp. VKM Ac-1817D]